MTPTEPENFSKAMEELENLTSEFENGEVDLETGIPKFKRGMELVRYLKKRLNGIENEIEEIKAEFKDVDEPSANSADEAESQEALEQKEDSKEDIPF
jgi:exodeoxyribonuclease VII small subunit